MRETPGGGGGAEGGGAEGGGADGGGADGGGAPAAAPGGVARRPVARLGAFACVACFVAAFPGGPWCPDWSRASGALDSPSSPAYAQGSTSPRPGAPRPAAPRAAPSWKAAGAASPLAAVPFVPDTNGYLPFAQPTAVLPGMAEEEARGDYRPGRAPLLAPTDDFPASLGSFSLTDAHRRIASEPKPRALATIRFFAPPAGDARRPSPSSPHGAYRTALLADGGAIPAPDLVDLYYHLRAIGLLGASSELALEGAPTPLSPLDDQALALAKEQDSALAKRIAETELRIAAVPQGAARSDALVRLGVLLLERHAIAFAMETSRYEKARAAWRLSREGDEPVRGSHAANAHIVRAAGAFRRATAETPGAPRQNEATFLLSVALARTEPRSAIPVLERFMPGAGPRKQAAHLVLAEVRAAVGDAKEAGRHYRAAMADADAPSATYAAYKLGWTYAASRPDPSKPNAHLLKALTAFKFVTRDAQAAPGRPGAAELARESARDTAWVFGRLGDVKAARAYFESIGARDLHLALGERVGSERALAGRRVEALALFSRLVRLSPLSPRLPALHARVLEQMWGLGRFDEAAAFLVASPEVFAPGSPWEQATSSSREALLARREWLVTGANSWARRFHERAKVVRDKGAYDTALTSYGVFLANAGEEGRDVAEAHFLSAEILARRGRALEAAAAFLRAGRVEERRVSTSPLTREAFGNAVVAAALAYKETRREELASPAGKGRGGASVPGAGFGAEAGPSPTAGEVERVAQARDRLRARVRGTLLESLDAWTRAYPGAPETPSRSHRAALLAFTMGDAGSARERWARLLVTSPDSADAREGVRFLLAEAARAQKFEDVAREARSFLATPGLAPTKLAADLREALEGAQFRLAANLSRAGRREEAARLFEGHAEEFPRDPDAPRARFNAANERFHLGAFGAGLAALDRFAGDFPSHPLRPRALFIAAHALESLGRMQDASAIHERIAAEFPTRRSAAGSLLRAAALRDAVGESKKAAALASAFLKAHAGDPAAHEAHDLVARVAAAEGDAASAREAWLRGARALASAPGPKGTPGAEARLAGALFLYGEAARASLASDAPGESESVAKEGMAVHGKLSIAARASAPARHGAARLGAVRIALLDRSLPALLDAKAVDASRFGAAADTRYAAVAALVQRYADTNALGDPATEIAVLYRAAELQEHSARLFLEAEPPPGLPPEKASALRADAEARARPLAENAARLYVAAWDKANSSEAASPFTAKLQVTLARLKPSAFAAVGGELPPPSYAPSAIAVSEETKDLLEQ